MADGLKLLILCAGMGLPVTAAAQPMDHAARQQVETTAARLADPAADRALADKAAALMAGLGLTFAAPAVASIPQPDFVTDRSAVIELVDIRLLLTQIAIQTGARDHIALVRAQGTRDHGVILLRGGFLSLQDLLALAQGTPAQEFVTRTDDGIVLTRPLAIWADAGLTLAKGDRLILSRETGSFVANLGWLDVPGGEIIGAGGPNTAEPGFRPFVLTARRGNLTAEGANFESLGFGDAAVFGGIAIASNGLVPPRFAAAITGSTLTDVRSLGLLGTTGATVAENHFTGSDGTAILIAHAQASTVANNRLDALTGPQAIRVTAAASGVTISGNLVSGPARTGILIDRESRDITIAGNLVQGSQTTGIGTNGATCVFITANLVASNGGVGVALSDTEAATISGNAILFNHGSGVLLRNQPDQTPVRVAGNVFVGNRDGLRGATPGKVTLESNDFEGQTPRVFAGDFAPLTVEWLRNRRDGVPIAVAALPAASVCANAGAN